MSKAEDVAKLRSWNLISDGGSRQAGSGLSGFYLLCQIQVLEAKTMGAHADLTHRRDCHRLRRGGAHREGNSRKDLRATGHRVKNPSCVL